MADLEDGEAIEVQGSGSARYLLRNVGEVYSCSCPAWRNQSLGIEKRTCKHLKALRGEAAELGRVGQTAPPPARRGAPAAAPAVAEAEVEGPPLLLANPWDNAQDLAGWWMSEKLDGVRAYWDGGAFVSRLGNRYHAPDWFTAGLPPTPLDGELWGGRKRFQRTISIVRRQDKSEHWKEISFVVFDAPSLDAPFEERLAAVRRHVEERRPAYAVHHEHVPCRGLAHLQEELARVEAMGGEGLMLRRPGSRYEVGRSASLLKVKSFFDAEARVVEHLAGTGRHKGRLGALLVELPDGTRFSVGTGFSDRERGKPPPPGAVVTFRYQELSEAGVPRFPSYVAVRDDIRWPPDNALVRRAAAASPPRDTVMSAEAATEKAGGGAARPARAKPVEGQGERSGARRFALVEGTSSKFWEIQVDGRQHTVRFGRVGSAGQARTKSFADEAAAARDAARLIEEKTGKGYVEE